VCPSKTYEEITVNQKRRDMMILTKPNTLSEEQCRELETLKTTTHDVRVYRRTKVILYRNAGYTPDEIQEHTEYSEREQRYVVRRYREEGVSGLHDRPRSGRPKRKDQLDSKEQSVKQEAVASVEAEALSEVELDTASAVPRDAGGESEPDSNQETEKTGVQLDSWSRVTLESMQTYHPKRYLRTRAHMLLLRDTGYSVSEIADILRISGQTIRQVCAHYDQDKLAGLYRDPGSGRVSQLQTEQWEKFAKWVREGPKSLGYRFVKWTTRSLRKYLFKRFNITFSREWIRQQLHHFVGYSWTRGKKVYAYPENEERNTERTNFSQKMLSYLEQARKGEMLVLFEDASLFTLFGEVGSSWSPLGETQEVPSAGKRGRVVVFGAADPCSGRTHYRIEDDSINQETTLRFIKQLVSYYQKHAPGIPLVIVLDKHPGHTSQVVEDFVTESEYVTLENIPTQSPDLNPQEHIWDWLGEQMIKNDFFETKDALKKAIRHFFCYIAGLKEQVVSWLGDLQKLYSEEVVVDAEF
jgi:transposase